VFRVWGFLILFCILFPLLLLRILLLLAAPSATPARKVDVRLPGKGKTPMARGRFT